MANSQGRNCTHACTRCTMHQPGKLHLVIWWSNGFCTTIKFTYLFADPRLSLPTLINASSVGTTHVNSTFVSYMASNKNGPTHGRAHKSWGLYIISKQHTTKMAYSSIPWSGTGFGSHTVATILACSISIVKRKMAQMNNIIVSSVLFHSVRSFSCGVLRDTIRNLFYWQRLSKPSLSLVHE